MCVPHSHGSVVGMAEAHTLGVVGTGALGAALAAAALDHGIATSVWNRTPGKARHLVDAGATPRPTIADLVGSSRVVVIAVSTYADVRSILDDTANVSGRTIVNLSSGTPDDAVALAGEVHRRGGRYLDGAAMSGTRLVGEPSATFFYSGDPEAFDDARNILAAFGKPLFLGADPATASGYDTAVFGMILGFLTASYQAMALLRRQGIGTEVQRISEGRQHISRTVEGLRVATVKERGRRFADQSGAAHRRPVEIAAAAAVDLPG